MEKDKVFLLFIFLLIKSILSEIYQLKTIPTKIKTLRRMHRALDNNKEDFLEEVYGDSFNLNYYYATLYLGPKKIPQTYILDTGSPTTTSPCNKCKSCGNHLNKPYELNNDSNIIQCQSDKCNLVPSSTCIDHKCGFSISYSEGSRLAGFFNLQEIYFEQINKTPNITSKSYLLPIGCTTTETHLFTTQLADGIMGLNNGGKSFVTLLYNNKIISKHLFSICFGQSDGYFSIGEIDTTYHKTKIEYIPIIRGETNFYININKIKIGEKYIDIDRYRGFIDSGTTISYFPNKIYNSIIDEFNSICDKKEKKCGEFRNVAGLGYCGFFKSVEEKKKALNEYWPDIIFYFEGHNYNLTANDYYYDYNEDKIGACLGFEGESTSKITLGGTFMHGHDIIFDKGNQQIGFAVADCNRSKFESNNKRSNGIDNNVIEIDKSDKAKDDSDVSLVEENEKKDKYFTKITFYLIVIFSILFAILLIIIIFFALKRCFCKKKYHPQLDDIPNNTNRKQDNVIDVKTDNI